MKLVFLAAILTVEWLAQPAAQPWPKYKLHVGTAPGAYTQVIDAGTALKVDVPNVAEDSDVYVAVQGYTDVPPASAGPIGAPLKYHTQKKTDPRSLPPVLSSITEKP